MSRPPQYHPPYQQRAANYAGAQHQPPPGQPRQPRHYPQYAPQPGQPNQPGPHGQTPTGGTDRRKGWKGPLLALAIGVGVLFALTVVVALTLSLWNLAFANNKELDVNKAQAGVRQILTDPVNGYGAKNVTGVKCNNGHNPIANKGDSFTCEVNINGTRRHVTVVFADDNGTYEVDRPK
jgi:hypothetical protein